jgi:hypothetical protein
VFLSYNFLHGIRVGALKFSGQFGTWNSNDLSGPFLGRKGKKVLYQLDKDEFLH